jgi:hypothetical protein
MRVWTFISMTTALCFLTAAAPASKSGQQCQGSSDCVDQLLTSLKGEMTRYFDQGRKITPAHAVGVLTAAMTGPEAGKSEAGDILSKPEAKALIHLFEATGDKEFTADEKAWVGDLFVFLKDAGLLSRAVNAEGPAYLKSLGIKLDGDAGDLTNNEVKQQVLGDLYSRMEGMPDRTTAAEVAFELLAWATDADSDGGRKITVFEMRGVLTSLFVDGDEIRPSELEAVELGLARIKRTNIPGTNDRLLSRKARAEAESWIREQAQNLAEIEQHLQDARKRSGK